MVRINVVPAMLIAHQQPRWRLEVFLQIGAESAIWAPRLAVDVVGRGPWIVAGRTEVGDAVLRDIRGSPRVHSIIRIRLVVLIVNGPIPVVQRGGPADH